MNGYEIINKIKDCDEIELLEFDFNDCFKSLKGFEELKEENKNLITSLNEMIVNSSPKANMQYHSRCESAKKLLESISNKAE